MTTVAILHPGAMGADVAASLVDVGHDVVWIQQDRSAATAERAERAQLRAAADATDCEVLLSLCPPGDAKAVAEAAVTSLGFRGVYIDANAISPQSAGDVAHVVESAACEYVDGSIIGPPPTESGTTRIYLSGSRASAVAPLFAGTRVQARVLDSSPFAASALKMCFATGTKISSAVLLGAAHAAELLGVADALAEEWELHPEIGARHRSATTAAEAKGWRWAAEMRQIAETFTAVGLPAGFGLAAEATFKGYPRPHADGDG